MNKEEALNDFVLGFRIAVYNGSAYSKNHPLYLKALNNLKDKLDTLFNFLDTIKVHFASNSLFIDGASWGKLSAYIELAQLFHQRKIEGIEIRRGVTLEELSRFINEVSRPKKEILRAGGLQELLGRESNPNIFIDELNYSQLLEGEGEEVVDIWVYKFRDAFKKLDAGKIKELSDNFGGIIGKFKLQSFLEDRELRQEISNFIHYLQENQKETFVKCTTNIFEWLEKYKEQIKDENIDKIKPFFANLNEEELANLLWNQVLSNSNFDAVSFRLFSRIGGEAKKEKISSTLQNKAAQKMILKDHPEAVMRIQSLLFSPGSEFISDVYRNTLNSLLEGISFEQNFLFDHNLLNLCYRFVLADLLNKERDKESLNLILKMISREWHEIIGSRNLEFLKYILDIIKEIKKEDPSSVIIFKELDRHISEYIEGLIWEEEQLELSYFVDYLEKPYFESDFYLAKIFDEKKVSPYGLQLFFKFFPDGLQLFYQYLEQKKFDIDFIGKITESLKILNSALSLAILKNIFLFASEFGKVEVLRAMSELSEIDEGFLFSILRKEDFALKEGAVIVLAKDEVAKKEAMKMLFSVSSPFGIKNKILLESMMIVENVRLREASGYLTTLSKRRFFWNKEVRRKAEEILKEWQT